MPVYKKLVRDRIPEVIEKNGQKCDIRVVSDKDERYYLLTKKLHEEVEEFIEDKNLEELADIMEVLIGLAENLGYNEEELIKKRNDKKEERGGFSQGIVLEKVY